MLGRRNKTRYKRDNSNALNHAMVQVCINGLKGKMEADSCFTANILEEHSSLPSRIRNLCNQLIPSCMHPLKRNLFPSLVVSMQKLKVSALEKKTVTRFLVAKGITKSPPLLSLDTRINLGLLHVNNTTQEEAKQPAESCTGTLPTDSVVSTLISQYHDVFSGLGKHKHIKAKLIVDESIQPVAHKDESLTI